MTAPAVGVTSVGRGARFNVKVLPRGSRNAIEGARDGALLIRVTAPPVDGAANDAAVRLVARALDLSLRDVRVVSGQTSRRKTIEVVGLDAAAVTSRLSAILR